ncbi:ribonuclease T [Sphingomonas sp. AOB5]|uniref:ribonuclease T2 family protein n=1 Tax=Sphingomonas sp. AOB5 TaxID=3034017 RepID=UPI0023F9B577|nr:ribonuclease T [Sphingomonas sp. AOB5]MDF7775201.1 ribonuclease T [Sphingomonas sp. AOB5]
MRKHLTARLAAMLIALTPGIASAQALMCRAPGTPPVPRPDLLSEREPRRVVPIASYTLALTWSPGYCRANRQDPDNRFQCASGNRFGFTLHGLWPDGAGREWPQYCDSASIVPPKVVRETMCATPDAQLIQHEWAKHGTCMDVTVDGYFRQARQLYGTLRYPDMMALSRRPLTVGQFKKQLVAVNPGLPESAIRVTVTRQGWLDELWLCLDTRYRWRTCRTGSGGAPDGTQLKIWRGGR